MSSSKVASPIEPYTWKLHEDAKAVALEELREDDVIREEALKQFREWIAKHPSIKNCRTDAPFLLRFLRTKKFSLPQACLLLQKYLTVRQLYPHWFQKLDVNDPALDEIIGTGYLLPLLKRDSKNRQVIMSFAEKFDPYKYTAAEMAKTHAIVTEALLDDEMNQVYGYTFINDETGLVMGHISMWGMADIKLMISSTQDSTPVRQKETHFVNIPAVGHKLIDFAKTFLNDKLRNRIFVHKSYDEIKEVIDPAILPKEYGGEVPMADMIESLKKKVKSMREEILALDEMSIDVDNIVNLEGDMKDELGTGLAGSFRKLEVD